MGKSRGTSDGSDTIVQDGDGLGFISFQGTDGTTMLEGAKIDAIVQSSVASDDMPTDLVFYTNNDTTTTAERLRITSTGNVGIGLTNPSAKLHTIGDVMIQGTGGTGEQTLFIGKSALYLPNSRGVAVAADQNSSADHDMVLKTSTGSSGLVERVRITSGGRVSIGGVSAPNQELHIHGTGTSYIQFSDESSGTGASDGVVIGLDHPHTYVWNYEAGDFIVATSATEKLRLDSSGRLLLNGSTDVRMEFGTNGTTGTNDRNWVRGSGADLMFNCSNGGNIRWEIHGTEVMKLTGKLTVPGVYSGTTTGGGPVYVESDGDLLRYTSSLKYKTDVEIKYD